MSGWYYNYWFEDLNFIPEAPSRYLLFKFFDDFLGNQGRIYPYLFTWSRLVTNIRAKLQEQAQKIKNPAWYTHDFFANLLEKTFTNRLGRGDFFDWFTKIFMVLTTTPYTYPVTDNQTFRTELRNNGAILRIPFEAYLPKRTDRENDHNYFFSIGSGVKIFPQAETLVTQTVFLSYFYVAPVLSYSERLFFKQPPLLRIKTEPDKTSIQDNEPAILQALQTIMFLSLSPAELHSYLALDPKTRTELIGQEPISFNANFLKSGSERPTTFVSKPFLIEQA